jgi:hypothetical protein
VLRAKQLKTLNLGKNSNVRSKIQKHIAMDVQTKAYPTIPLSDNSELVRGYL